MPAFASLLDIGRKQKRSGKIFSPQKNDGSKLGLPGLLDVVMFRTVPLAVPWVKCLFGGGLGLDTLDTSLTLL